MEHVTKKVNKSNKKVNKNDLNNNQRRNNMKTKIFIYDSWKRSLEDFEQEVNDFMATVQVIDVKHSTTISDTWITFTMLVLYK